MTFSGLQKVTLIDYPGKIACTLFTHGCNFRCKFCHNPELVISKKAKLQELDESQVFEFLKKRRGKIDGVCITGGEPLIHAGIRRFIEKVRDMGFYVKLDTNGSYPDRLAKILNEDLVDYVAMDVKADEQTYCDITETKVDTEDIKKSIALIKNSGQPYEFRGTFVRGLHDEKTAEGIGKLVDGAKTYYIQNFNPSRTIDSSLGKNASFEYNELEGFKSVLNKHVRYVYIRD